MEKSCPNILRSSRQKPKSVNTLRANCAKIEFEVYYDDNNEEASEEVMQSNSVDLPSFDALDIDPNKDILLADSMKIEIEKAGLPALSIPGTVPSKAPSAPITLPVAIAPKVSSTSTTLPVVSVLTDPCCAVCKEKLNAKLNYVKVPDSPYVRNLWEITTEMRLTPHDLVCQKHFSALDVPMNQVRRANHTGKVNIYNHRLMSLPCLTPIEGCCVRNCPNSDNDAKTLFTFDLRHADKWLKRLGDLSLFKKTKKEQLRVRACPSHFDPSVLHKYKFFETELVPTRNLPGQQMVLRRSDVTSTPAGTFNVSTAVVLNRFQCLYKNCPRMANTIYKFFKPPTSLERAKKWLKACNRNDILRLPNNDLKDFITKAEGICKVHIGRVYRGKNEINRMICGYKSCQSTYPIGTKVFKFPIHPGLRKKWFEVAGIKREPKPIEMEFFTKGIGICIRHFLDSDFNEDRDLRPYAIPQNVNVTEKEKNNKVDGMKLKKDFASPLEARNKCGIYNRRIDPTCTNDIKDSNYFPSLKRVLECSELIKDLLEVQKETSELEKQRLDLESQRLDFESLIGSQLLTLIPIFGGMFGKTAAGYFRNGENGRKRKATDSLEVLNDPKAVKEMLEDRIKGYFGEDVKDIKDEESDGEVVSDMLPENRESDKQGLFKIRGPSMSQSIT